MINAEEIGKNIKKYREKRGLVQEILAEKADVDVSTISRLERGSLIPKMQTLDKIADALEIDITQLLIKYSNKNNATKQAALNLLVSSAEKLSIEDLEYFTKVIDLYTETKRK